MTNTLEQKWFYRLIKINAFDFIRDSFFGFQSPEPIKVVVTGAAGQIAYSLLYQIANGDVFGSNQPLILHLLDIPPMMGVLDGVVMEIADCALPLVKQVVPTADPVVAFKDVDAAFLVGAMPRKEGMERKDLLSANVKIFKAQVCLISKQKTIEIKFKNSAMRALYIISNTWMKIFSCIKYFKNYQQKFNNRNHMLILLLLVQTKMVFLW